MTADADIEDDLLGLTAADLQEDIEITGTAISGTLKAVAGYTGFSGDSELQSGHYIALHFASVPEGATITCELTGGSTGHPVTLGEDGILVARVTDKSTQTLVVVASANGYATRTVVYDLSGLTMGE